MTPGSPIFRLRVNFHASCRCHLPRAPAQALDASGRASFRPSDWRRFVRSEFQADHPFALYECKYSPEQPRVPAGDPLGGQWTSGGNRTTELSAQRRRNLGPRMEPTPGQAARLAVAEAQARDAIARVRELDRNWQPTPSFRETVEGQIAAAQAETREAEARLQELSRVGIGPGPYAGESIPARGPERDFTAAERREINRIGSETGCHTCGTKDPGTRFENFVLDHQPPTAWNPLGLPQRLYPQCLSCSSKQGNWISQNGGRR
jgi:hypothetical protein